MTRRICSRFSPSNSYSDLFAHLMLYQLEQDYEQALNDYELYNGNMKQDLPQFMVLSTQFIDPLFHSFFYMQYVLPFFALLPQ